MHSVYSVCIFFGDSESKIVSPLKEKRKKEKEKKRNIDSGEKIWYHQFSSIDAPADPNGDTTCCFVDI